MTTTTMRPGIFGCRSATPGRRTSDLDAAIKDRMDDCAYRYYFNQIRWRVEDDKLVLTGRVPSFYLKQVLQTLIRGIDSVGQIDNRVDVVSSTGLSTTAAG